MSLTVGIKITNLDEFKRAFNKSPQTVGRHLTKAIRTSVLTVGRRSRQNAPVDTGRLRASHLERFERMSGEVSTNVNYDLYVHEGTRYMKARPFLYDAVRDSKTDIERVFDRELQEALNSIAREV